MSVRGLGLRTESKGSKGVFLILILLTGFSVCSIWMICFGASTLAGDKLVNGMLYGLAESAANFASGIFCRYATDKTVYNAGCALCMVCYSALYFLGTSQGGPLVFTIFFLQVFGLGAMFNVIYLLIELRVPPIAVGSSITICMMVGQLFGAVTPLLMTMDQPIPFAVTIGIMAV